MFKIGDVIRNRRVQLGLTQEQLCEGICEVSTLSKIENNRQVPSRARLNVLMQRLGLVGEKYYGLVSQAEYEIQELIDEIENAIGHYEYDRIAQLADELEKKPGAEDAVVKQMVLRARALSGRIENGHHDRLEPEERMKQLMQAIRKHTMCCGPWNY